MRGFVSNHLAAILTGGAVVLGGLYFYQVSAEQARADCQSSFNIAFGTQLTERSRIATNANKANTDLIKGVGKLILSAPSEDPKVIEARYKEYIKLFTTYNVVVAEVEKDRAATPLPPLPDC